MSNRLDESRRANFNFQTTLACRLPPAALHQKAGPQLMAGNVLVVKHACCVAQCAIAFEKLLLDAIADQFLAKLGF